MLLDDARRDGKPKARPGIFGGKERIEKSLFNGWRNSFAGVGDAKDHVRANGRVGAHADVVLIQVEVLRRYGQGAARGHGIAGIDTEVHEHLMKLGGVAQQRPKFGYGGRTESDVFRKGLLNHPAHLISLNELGSIIIDLVSNRLDAMLLGPNGISHDHFTLRKRNLPPAVQNSVVSVEEDGSAVITLLGSDPDGSAVAYTIVSAPTNGTLRVADSGIASTASVTDGSSLGSVSNLLYTPRPNFHGADGLTFRVSDGSLDSGIGTIAITVASVNDPPVADASATPQRSIIAANNRDAIAVLDASRSSDVDNDPLQFLWSEGSVPLATGMVATVTLPVGSHTIILEASDGMAATNDSVTIEIISGTHTVQELVDMLISSGLPRKSLPPLLATLNAASDAVQRGNVGAAVNQLRAFQNKVRAQIALSNPVFAAQLIDLAQRIIDSIDRAPRPNLEITARNNPRTIQISFRGNPAHAYVIETSTDMIHWESIGAAKYRGQTELEFTDARTGARLGHQFYRVRSP